jgi:hypothetical protein
MATTTDLLTSAALARSGLWGASTLAYDPLVSTTGLRSSIAGSGFWNPALNYSGARWGGYGSAWPYSGYGGWGGYGTSGWGSNWGGLYGGYGGYGGWGTGYSGYPYSGTYGTGWGAYGASRYGGYPYGTYGTGYGWGAGGLRRSALLNSTYF